jgi:hypothetical protein
LCSLAKTSSVGKASINQTLASTSQSSSADTFTAWINGWVAICWKRLISFLGDASHVQEVLYRVSPILKLIQIF